MILGRPPRPRLLYGSLFCYFAVTGGRFLAPFLEHESFEIGEMQVGTILALQVLISSLLGSAGGAWADARERRSRGRGRAQVMFVGVALGGAFFLLHGTSHLFASQNPTFLQSFEWHLILRVLYACSSSLVAPVLDGITLAYLEQSKESDPSNFGQERLHGAIWWAIANMLIGPLVDIYGFTVLYGLGMLSTAVVFVCIAFYVQGQPECVDDEEISIVSKDNNKDNLHKDEQQQTQPILSMWTLLGIMAGTSYGAAFLFSTVSLSAGASVVESLIFLYFAFLGGSNTLCGFTVALTVLFEIPIFQVAPSLLERWGAGRLQQVASVAYVLRVVGYTLIPRHHMAYVLFLEPLHGVTYACAKTSGVDFVAQHTPAGYEASGQGLLSLFQGMGSVLGLFIGGWVQETLGPRIMYRLFAGIVAIGIAVFGSVSFCSARSSSRRKPDHAVLVVESDGLELPASKTVLARTAKR